MSLFREIGRRVERFKQDVESAAEDTPRTCEECGQPLADDQTTCPNCGASVDSDED